MKTFVPFDRRHGVIACILAVVCLALVLTGAFFASAAQRDLGHVAVSDVRFPAENGRSVRAKLFRPVEAEVDNPFPGVVFVHGYQSNREVSDAYCLEMARRGFVVVNIDSLGRGNSDFPGYLDDPDFDETFGAGAAFGYLRALPYVDPDRCGLMGHSLGAEIVYHIARQEPAVKGLVISGFGYTTDATPSRPKNMLMIFGKYDEYRKRMTATRNFEEEWMNTDQTVAAFGVPNPKLGETYGNFDDGTARKVYMPKVTHIMEAHDRGSIAETVVWMRNALEPDPAYWVAAEKQIWQIKEWGTLMALVGGIALVMPLGYLLLLLPVFAPLRRDFPFRYAAEKGESWKPLLIKGILDWLYMPLILVLFAVHVFLFPIDRVFPLMVVNGIVFWFLVTGLIGYALFRRRIRKAGDRRELDLVDLGLSSDPKRVALSGGWIVRALAFGVLLFTVTYLLEYILEKMLIVDYRFVFAFASDLTGARFLLFLEYLPLLFVAFVCNGIFLFSEVRPEPATGWGTTWVKWSVFNVLIMILPLASMLAVQYIPLLISGVIPFVGPGGALVNFVINLYHIIGVLMMIIPVSTWLFQLTGKVYIPAFMNAALVAWFFTSSQVVAPVPVNL